MKQLAILGASGDIASEEELQLASELGSVAAQNGYTCLVGGDDGIMGAAGRAAFNESGKVVVILPAGKRLETNMECTAVINTGLPFGTFSQVLLSSCNAAVAIGGGAGTLIEICYAYLHGIPIAILGANSNLSRLITDGKIPDNRGLQEIKVHNNCQSTLEWLEMNFTL